MIAETTNRPSALQRQLVPRRRRGYRLAALGYLAWALAAAWAGPVAADTSGVIDREYEIKAAFLYHFSNYIDWPADDFPTHKSPFVIGVYQDNPFGSVIQRVAHRKKVDGRRIDVRIIHTAAEASDCQILFVPKSVPIGEQNAVLRATLDHPVLVVGEQSGFVQRGGNVQFFLEGNKVRFAFGAGVTKRDDLKVSSKLLTLAKIIAVD